MANKKKKLIPIFAVSAAALLFGGLLYCGVSMFPELLEPDQEEQVDAPKEVLKIKEEMTISHNDDVSEDEGIPALTRYTTSANGDNTQNMIVVNVKATSSNSTPAITTKEEKASFRDKELFVRKDGFSFETGLVSSNFNTITTNVETNQVNEHLYVSGNEHNTVSAKINKLTSNHANKSVNYHREIAECSILVIGIVNVLSFLLVAHRKRKMFR